MTQREFDLVLYGATGFAGKLTAQYLANAAGGARIALAGRSADKLQAARATLGGGAADWPLVIADADNPSTLSDMAARTRVVVTTVGPYTRYGLPLVAACAAAGTDYADLTGETMFIRDSIDRCHEQAAANGARIVHSCGFDSVPSDLTVYALYRRVVADGAGALVDTDLVLRSFAGGVSGGTAASMIEVLRTSSTDPGARAAMTDPYTLSPDRAREPELGDQPDVRWRRGAEIAPELAGYWTGAFAMAAPNSRIVRRSNALLDYAYGRKFAYTEQMSCGRSPVAPVAAALLTASNAATLGLGGRHLDKIPPGLLDRVLPKPGTGPSERTRERGHYRVETYTTTTSGRRYVATMAQQGDPGYKATAVLLGECGLALALDRDKLSDLRGVLTPAAAMGDALLTRLPAAGVVLETAALG
ncbi:saccharopine dehydrogenase family protein [Mycolicibacterium goodii]|uniref:Saccharopine dehydrogenase NADP-binding domain-containing protein n=1 Tax=Mycolicibacterium goodii TaxID=134601 RepID=A0ABS6HFV3_MYCGD|nr:trans-acting enoyl reductase family protein [Mycolicibacterium goodii]MBU8811089.1 saccharopine dehydrogenase NADP-binding domain-containing protein [Mycolicibacterium goodii]MBU8821564.1 saccharopine dehydrogenase NADP-binding domain-containing protein [Mycolicibacterium goodii]MBU8830015.1 saccharopine dehydrogenase NADP-binding domain-containing protein [Mycolicibacterium goodii]MBU8836111.1 saccharopine dehydrogenase NADP-binding domain-containing protein [Mycolicibacterium goodii]ULN45